MKLVNRLSHILVKYYFYILIILFLLTRLINILSLPIFNDEAIYIDWANKMRIGVVPLFYALYDGKPPLHFLLISFLMPIFKDPLLSGRMLSVFAGLFTLIGIKKISEISFGKEKTIIPIILYIISPMFLFFDRQSLQEALLTAQICWIMYFTIAYFKEYKIKHIIILSFVFASAIWTKISVLTILFPILLMFFYKILKDKKNRREILISLIVFLIWLSIMIFPLFIQKQSYLIFSRNDRYSITLDSININIFGLWIKNIIKLLRVYFWYLNLLIPFIVLNMYLSIKSKRLIDTKYLYVFLIPVFLLLLSSRGLVDRYIIPFSLPLILIASEGLYYLKNRFKLLPLIIFIPILFISIFQIFDIDQYLIKMNKYAYGLDLFSYIGGFASGYGVKDAINYIKENGGVYKKIYIGVRVDAGNPESAVMAYFLTNKNSKFIPIYFDSQFTKLPLDKDFVGNYYPFYFVSRENNVGGMDKYLTEVKRFYKPDGTSYVGVYKFNGNI